MKRSLLLAVSLFAVTLLANGPLIAQLPGQDPDDQKCDFPVYKGKELDRKIKILEKPQPDFTSKERREHDRQSVTLTAMFCGSGKVVQIKVKNPVSDSVDAKAIEAAKRIRFVPAEKDGNKVSQALMLEYFVQ
jgi:hypothetical protein